MKPNYIDCPLEADCRIGQKPTFSMLADGTLSQLKTQMQNKFLSKMFSAVLCNSYQTDVCLLDLLPIYWAASCFSPVTSADNVCVHVSRKFVFSLSFESRKGLKSHDWQLRLTHDWSITCSCRVVIAWLPSTAKTLALNSIKSTRWQPPSSK